MLIDEDSIEVSGSLKEFARISDKGNVVKSYFCPKCGVRIYGVPGYVKEVFSLKPGTLDDTSWLKPTAMLWLKSSQKWFKIPNHIEKFDEQ
tara:strand:+ start:1410 stop:1682 length:273 start_codon:yes stop_codon:yes gene_type:complete